MKVYTCPNCDSEIAEEWVGDECPDCGDDLTTIAINILDFINECDHCQERIDMVEIDSNGICPECGEDSGLGGMERGYTGF